MSEIDRIAARLTELGFSQYEARTYVGLLLAEQATGYTIGNQAGVPQPKVYEILPRLVDRGAAVRLSERPGRYAAVPPAALLDRLEREFRGRLDAARAGLESLPHSGAADPPLPIAGVTRLEDALARTREGLKTAQKRVYLHARTEELRPLADAVAAASEAGIEFVIVHFGPLPFAKPRGQVVRHESTEGTLYPSRQSRHLAAVADSDWSLWAVARDGRCWEGMHGRGSLLAGLIKTYIRHDVFVQRMYADAPELFEDRYGPGLLRLNEAESAADSTEAEGA